MRELLECGQGVKRIRRFPSNWSLTVEESRCHAVSGSVRSSADLKSCFGL
jgi:hypothetical protein